MKIDDRLIGNSAPPYIIAELSANHNGSLETALNLIASAKANGADAIKLQTYTADTLTIDSSKSDFLIHSGLWQGRTLYQLYDQAHTPWEWHGKLFAEARKIGISIFSSPFDLQAIELLESLSTPAYKIASFELIDHELVAAVASTGKPIILSTGLANSQEIEEALNVALSAGAKIENIALLHCLSSYPAPPEEYNLGTIVEMKRLFGTEIGLSDHSLGNEVAISAVALGANLVEKHFTSDRKGGGPDDSFSMDADGLDNLRASLNVAWKARGYDNFRIQPSEVDSLRYRRSLYVVRDVAAGQKIEKSDVRSIRPGYGIAPKHLTELLGLIAPFKLSRGERVSEDLFAEIKRYN